MNILHLRTDLGGTIGDIKNLRQAFEGLGLTLNDVKIASQSFDIGPKGGITGGEVVLDAIDDFNRKLKVVVDEKNNIIRVAIKDDAVNSYADAQKANASRMRGVNKAVAQEMNAGFKEAEKASKLAASQLRDSQQKDEANSKNANANRMRGINKAAAQEMNAGFKESEKQSKLVERLDREMRLKKEKDADTQTAHGYGRKLSNTISADISASFEKVESVNYKGASHQQVVGILKAKGALQSIAAEGKVTQDRLLEISKLVQDGKAFTFAFKNRDEEVALNKILNLYTAIRAVATNPKVQAARDPVAEENQARRKTQAYNQVFGNRLVHSNDNVNDISPKQDEAIALKSNKLQGILVTAQIETKRLDDIFRHYLDGNIAGLGTLSDKERQVVAGVAALSKEYDNVGTAANKAAKTAEDAEAKALDAAKKWANGRIRLSEKQNKEQDALDAKLLAEKTRRVKEYAKVFDNQHADEKRAAAEKVRVATAAKKAEAPDVVGGLVQRSGGLQGTFTQQGVVNIQRANLELQKLYATSDITKNRLNDLFTAIKTGSIKSLGTLTTEELKAELALRKLITAFDTAATAGKRSNEIMLNMRNTLRLIAIQQAHLAISKITNAILGSIEAGKEYEIRLAEIQTITQNANRSTTQWSGSLVKLSNDFGLDILKTTEAAYEAASNQIAKGAGVTTFLADAFKLARTTAASAEQAVNILSSTINAYGTSAVNAERYSAVLFKLADLGRVRVGQLANTFGNSATLANNMGISIEELSAAIATLTIQGIRPDTSMTLINNIMLKLIKPTAAMTELFNEWGVASGEAAVATFGFQGVLARLDQEFQRGGVARLAEIGSDMRAIRGQVGLTGQAFGKFNEALDAMTNAQIDYDKAAEMTANTIAFRLNKEFAALNNLFVADTVQRYNKLVAEFAHNVGGLANTFKPFVDGGLNTVTMIFKFTEILVNLNTWLTKISFGFDVLIPRIFAIIVAWKTGNALIAIANSLLAMNSIRLIAAGNGATFYQSVIMALRGSTEALEVAQWRLAASQAVVTLGFTAVAGIVALAVASYMQSYYELGRTSAELEANLNNLSRESLSNLNKTLDKQNQEFNKAITDRQKSFNSYAAAIRAVLNEKLGEKLKNILDPIAQMREQRGFEFSLISADEVEKLDLTKKRINELGNEIGVLSRSDNMEKVQDKFKEMANLAKSYTDAAASGLDKLNKEIKKFKVESENKALENQLAGLSDPKKIAKLQEIISKLREDAKKSAKDDNLEDASDKLKEAEKLNEKLVSISGKGQRKGTGKTKGVSEEAEIRAEQLEILERQRDKMQKNFDEGRGRELEIADKQVKGIDNVAQGMKRLDDATVAARNSLKELNEELNKLDKDKASSEDSRQKASEKAVTDLFTYTKQVSDIHNRSWVDSKGDPRYKERKELIAANMEASDQYQNILKTNDKVSPERSAKLDKLLQTMYENKKKLEQNVMLGGGGFSNSNGQHIDDQKDATGTSLGYKANAARDSYRLYKEQSEESSKVDAKINDNKIQKDSLLMVMDKNNKTMEILARSIPGAMERYNVDFSKHDKNFADTVKEFDNASRTIVKGLKFLKENDEGNAKGKMNGGMLGFAGGGMLNGPLGRDNQIVKAHSGESFMNKESTAKFHSQLVAMNSGGNGAQGLMSSGSTINVGDVNVNLSGNNNQKNAVEVAREIRRSVRAGTSKLS